MEGRFACVHVCVRGRSDPSMHGACDLLRRMAAVVVVVDNVGA